MKHFPLFCVCCAFAAFLGACQDDFAERHTGGQQPVVPFDFDWKTTRDIALTVSSPTITKGTPEFAWVNVYSSPVLSEENMVARGLIRGGQSLHTVFTLPSAVEQIYVQTVVPDGRRAAEMVSVRSSELSVAGLHFGALSQRAPVMKAAQTASSFSIPVTESVPGSFDFTIDHTQSLVLDGNNGIKNYYIPQGVTIDGTQIEMGGWTGAFPTLYVAGKLLVKGSKNLYLTRLVVLEGGVVEVEDALTVNVNGQLGEKAALYVFPGGELRVEDLNIDRAVGVIAGKVRVEDDCVLSPSARLYVAAGGDFDVDEMHLSSAEVHNDGACSSKECVLDLRAVFTNYENGEVRAEEFEMSNAELTQKGLFRVEKLDLKNNVLVNNQCRMEVEELESKQKGNRITLGGGSVLKVSEEIEMQHTQVDMARQSLFLIEKLDDDDKEDFYKNTFNGPAPAAGLTTPAAVLRVDNGHGSDNRVYGLLEIVCDAQNNHKIFSQIKEGATLVRTQTVDISATDCNGGEGRIELDPVQPEEVFDVEGALYTYCFEDGWPWFGDYDMNDLVVAVSVDRRMKGDKVEAIRINWEPRASGADNTLSLAVALDKISVAQVAAVVTSHQVGAGAFAGENGLEPGSEYAVIPLFNSVGEVLGRDNVYINTEAGMPATPTQQYTTTVTFTEPVAQEAVTESALNYFVVATRSGAAEPERWREIHLPSYSPTIHAVVTGFNTILPAMPYKFYAQGGDLSNNGLMWGLMIPGEFRYPNEMMDIRTVYEGFLPWAQSGGATNGNWYTGKVNEEKLYR